jgi:hypothetical protein
VWIRYASQLGAGLFCFVLAAHDGVFCLFFTVLFFYFKNISEQD